jgi:mannosylglucosylglycerate synthase
VADADVLIVHNVLNYHFNLPLTAALYHLLDRRAVPRMIAWCHDISRYVNLSSGAVSRTGFPWGLLRTPREEITYVAVSSRRQRMLAATLGCPPGQIRVIPNGVAPEDLWGLDDFGQRILKDFDLLNRDVNLLMPVRITRAKNIEFALRVTAALKASGFEPLLLITGPPDPHVPASPAYADELCALRRELGLDCEVAFLYETHPSLTISSVAELYRMADVIFLPSHREGFGLPVLEAGLIGKPIFASDVPALDEVGTNSIYRIAPNDTPNLVVGRIARFTQEDSSYQLSRRVRKHFTWQAIFARTIEPLMAESKA